MDQQTVSLSLTQDEAIYLRVLLEGDIERGVKAARVSMGFCKKLAQAHVSDGQIADRILARLPDPEQ